MNEFMEKRLRDALQECEHLREENKRLKGILATFSLRTASTIPDNTKVPALNIRPSLQSTNSSIPHPSKLSVKERVQLFQSLFQGRDDVYAIRWESQKGRSGYSPACANEWDPLLCNKPCSKCPNAKHIPLSREALHDHLLGKVTIGVYPLCKDETCYFLAADFDKADWEEDTKAFLNTCRDMKVPAALERSRSGKGGHVWIFFSETISAKIARQLGSALLTRTMESRHKLGLDSYDRFFPNQDTMPKGGFGNLIALPLQHKPRQKNNSVFVDDALHPYPDQWDFLANIQ